MPQEAINQSCPVCFVATDIVLECTARKGKSDDTAALPMRGAAAVEICIRENGRKPERSNAFGRSSHQQRWQPGQRDGLKLV